jgi:hypothetical protein
LVTAAAGTFGHHGGHGHGNGFGGDGKANIGGD